MRVRMGRCDSVYLNVCVCMCVRVHACACTCIVVGVFYRVGGIQLS